MNVFIDLLKRCDCWTSDLALVVLARIGETLMGLVALAVLMLVIGDALHVPEVIDCWPFAPLSTWSGAITVIGLLALSYLVRWGCVRLAVSKGQRLGYKVTARLRCLVADHLMVLPGAYFQDRDSGQLTHVFMNDVTQIEQFPGLILPRLIALIVFPIGAIAAACWMSVPLGGALVVVMGIAVGGLVVGNRLQEKATEERAAALGLLSSRVLEFLAGIHVIRTFGLVARQFTPVREAITLTRDRSKALTVRYVMAVISVPIVVAAGAVGILAHGLMGQGRLWGGMGTDPWTFLVLILLTLRLSDPIGDLVDLSSMTQQMASSARRLYSLLTVPAARIGVAARPDDTTIQFDDVTFAHPGGKTVLSSLSFTASPGDVVALVGATGAGKTTVLRLLNRTWSAQQGHITIGGIDLADFSAEAFSDLIAVVSQTVVLFTLSVRDNIRLARPDASDADVEEAARAARCHDFVSAMPKGYDTVLSNGGAMLSGGQRQRLALARLFLRDCPILLLDEASSALDVENERLVQEALSSLARGRTVLVVAHRLWTIRDADQILVLDHGALVATGRHPDLLAEQGPYQKLWRALEQGSGWQGSVAARAPVPVHGGGEA